MPTSTIARRTSSMLSLSRLVGAFHLLRHSGDARFAADQGPWEASGFPKSLRTVGMGSGAANPGRPSRGGTARPTVTRRREVSDASTRSLLTTVLGEFVLPDARPVWTQTVLDVLSRFGIEEKSARQALSRVAAEGWLSSERIGRRVRWALTPPGRRLLVEGAERIYGFGSGDQQWDGRWLVVMVSVPETKRELRHRLRTRLSWAGFGSPEPGVWVSPHVDAEVEAKSILADLALTSDVISFIATYGALGDVQRMVAAAWDLQKVADRYENFIDQFTGLDANTPEAALLAQTRLVHEWRRFPFLDPRLPRELLPAKWSGSRATKLFNDNHSAWHGLASQGWTDLLKR
jgi:phenylacetic acid degradation operon negative regulatory protein